MIDPDMNDQFDLHSRLGARPRNDGCTEFCVWAPTAERVRVCVVGGLDYLMVSDSLGYHSVIAEGIGPGDRYWIQVDDHPPRPDPTSRFQPEGVHGPSEIVGRDFLWTDHDWQGVDRQDWIIYELHIGSWTAEGTMLAAIERLDELVELGVTAVELMPLADAAGRWNWGYDGVNLFAPNRNYGVPDDVRRFVDAAHGKGLAVFLDVVYNHFGPEGNYLAQVGPYLSEQHRTIWGAAPNFDGPQHAEGLRNFILANALYWLDEFHFDGLRVDAIHCMVDTRSPHIVEDLSRVVDGWSKHRKRNVSLIAESNVHDTQMIRSLEQGGIGFDAEWCDDFLHSVFAVVRPGERLCEREYLPGTDLSQTLHFGYVYEGSLFQKRGRQQLCERSDTSQLIYSIQTHDFVGNHPLGQRLHQVACLDTQRACAALLVMTPAIPMLFMGEEFATAHSFPFFVDFGDAHLRESVVRGRRAEYPQHDWDTGVLPIDAAAFQNSKIGKREAGDQLMWQWYRSLIAIRKQWKKSGLICDANVSVQCDLDVGLYRLDYAMGGQSATIVARLVPESTRKIESVPIEIRGNLILDSREGMTESHMILPNHAKVFADDSARS